MAVKPMDTKPSIADDGTSASFLRQLLDTMPESGESLPFEAAVRTFAGGLQRLLACDLLAVLLRRSSEASFELHLSSDFRGILPLLLPASHEQFIALDALSQSGMPFLCDCTTAPNAVPPYLTQTLLHVGYVSFALLPLRVGQQSLGCLLVAWRSPHKSSDAELERMRTVAALASLGLDAALARQKASEAARELDRQSDHLNFLLETSTALLGELDLRELFVKLSQQDMGRNLRHDFAAIALLEPGGKQLRLYALDLRNSSQTIHREELISCDGSPEGWVCQQKKLLRLTPLSEHLQRFPCEFTARLVKEGIYSAIWTPLQTRNRVLGTFCAGVREANFSDPEPTVFLQQLANQIAIAIENAFAFQQIAKLRDKLAEEKNYLEDELRNEMNFDEIVGDSPSTKRILKQVEIVAPTDSTVLLLGETGVGKELIARAIHRNSLRASRTFVKINCPAIPSGLLESELFGHERGAFTGAIAQKTGRAELAHGGTLFLDEVGELPLELQPKLLRLLQEHEFERIGSNVTRRTDARIIAATNRDLAAMVSEGSFRSDLYYRLYVFPILIAPLRERREEIPSLARFFTQKHARRLSRPIERIATEAMNALVRWDWPGNVRELENFLERAVLLNGQNRVLRFSPSELGSSAAVASAPIPANTRRTFVESERQLLEEALEACHGRVAGPNGAAERLGMKRTTLISKLKRLGLR